jgi:hypothetical protein
MKKENKNKIRILPELEELIPPLREEEFLQLEENILREGCREPLLVWPRHADEHLLIDGHNRLRICRTHQLNFSLRQVFFHSLAEAKDFMIANQLGRRNLNPQQASYLRGMRFRLEKLEKGKYDRKRAEQGKTAARLAEEYKLSPATIERDGTFAHGLDIIAEANPDFKKRILSGRVRLRKGMIRQASRLGKLQPFDSLDELLAQLEGHPINHARMSQEQEKQRQQQREEARMKLLELCEVMQDKPFVSVILAKNILAAARELHESFDK